VNFPRYKTIVSKILHHVADVILMRMLVRYRLGTYAFVFEIRSRVPDAFVFKIHLAVFPLSICPQSEDAAVRFIVLSASVYGVGQRRNEKT
jgi:hypothetical protein